jgi:hypothetical protein
LLDSESVSIKTACIIYARYRSVSKYLHQLCIHVNLHKLLRELHKLNVKCLSKNPRHQIDRPRSLVCHRVDLETCSINSDTDTDWQSWLISYIVITNHS